MDFSTPTKPSFATRFPALKSRGSCRGFAVYQDRAVVFESHLELMVLFILALLPNTAAVIDQPPAVTYTDDNGCLRRHTFDYLVIGHDSTRALVAVKPAAKVAESGIQRIVQLIAEQLPRGTADTVHLITDAHFSYADRFNAVQAFECCRFPIGEHHDAIANLASQLLGAVRICDLVDASGLGGMGFRAIIRAMTYGLLKPVLPGRRITPDSYVVRPDRTEPTVS